VFDPFKDFETAGYLRNKFAEKDPRTVREMEHELFRANLDEAMAYLAAQIDISYVDFLHVHRTLFSAFYPWAGQDRTITAQEIAVKKGEILFCHPYDARRAVEQGLRLGQDLETMQRRPGEVMGFFAYGHPFLDGNGRTMLVVHSELCHRAGFSISWELTAKSMYLTALSEEITNPGKGILDAYLRQFVAAPVHRKNWGQTIHSLNGLDGLSTEDRIEGDINDPLVVEKYKEFEARRGYRID
jgi:cell filamentation protein